jgi:hypothetical protein
MKQMSTSPEMIDKSKAGRFKRGQDPHNRGDGIGTDFGDGYIEIKNLPSGLKQKRILNQNTGSFMNEHGPIPKDSIIQFVDGNKNFDISNLK